VDFPNPACNIGTELGGLKNRFIMIGTQKRDHQSPDSNWSSAIGAGDAAASPSKVFLGKFG